MIENKSYSLLRLNYLNKSLIAHFFKYLEKEKRFYIEILSIETTVSLHISPYPVLMWENTGIMWTRITPNTDTQCAVLHKEHFHGKAMQKINTKR